MDIVREVAENVAARAVSGINADCLSDEALVALSDASPDELTEVGEAVKAELPKVIEWALACIIDGVENRRGSPLENFNVPPPPRPF
jgi:hypothetical protein